MACNCSSVKWPMTACLLQTSSMWDENVRRKQNSCRNHCIATLRYGSGAKRMNSNIGKSKRHSIRNSHSIVNFIRIIRRQWEVVTSASAAIDWFMNANTYAGQNSPIHSWRELYRAMILYPLLDLSSIISVPGRYHVVRSSLIRKIHFLRHTLWVWVADSRSVSFSICHLIHPRGAG